MSSFFLRCQDFEDVEAAAFPKTSNRVGGLELSLHIWLYVFDLIFVNRVMRYGQHTASSNEGLDTT